MLIKLEEIMRAMEQIAPNSLAESWDNVGLQCGHPEQHVSTAFLALTPSMDVIKRANACGAQLLITHHPLIFKAIKSMRADFSPARELTYLIDHKMALFVAHTNFDIADNGVNDVLAKLIGLEETNVLQPTASSSMYKVVVYVPTSHINAIQEAVFQAGAGRQGNYKHCSWSVEGIGGFTPIKEAVPFIGTTGERSEVRETKIEVLVGESVLEKALNNIKIAHPYEEPAVDVFKEEFTSEQVLGLGRIGTLPKAVSLAEFVGKLEKLLQTEGIRYNGEKNSVVKTVALCGGSGSSFIDAASKSGADAYLTGDISYHDFQHANEIGLTVIDAGHFSTEKPAMFQLKKDLEKLLPTEIKILVDEDEKNFFCSNQKG